MNPGNEIILFDGICNLCNSSVSFIQKHDKAKQFRFVALQSDEGKKLTETFRLPPETDSVILIRRDAIYLESEAVLEICKLLPAPWNRMGVFKAVPKLFRDKIYRWVARNRYQWFGKNMNCEID